MLPHPRPPPRVRSAKGHLLNAGICLLCSADVHTIRAALERYRDLDLNFDNSREANFLSVRALFCEAAVFCHWCFPSSALGLQGIAQMLPCYWWKCCCVVAGRHTLLERR